MDKPSTFERFNSWIRTSITLRLITIGILILLLLIPIDMVQDIIREREYRKQDAVDEVSGKWGYQQTLVGPVLTVPYNQHYKNFDKDDKDKYTIVTTKHYAHFFPDELLIDGEVVPQELYRGIFKVPVYQAQVDIQGYFTKPDFKDWGIDSSDILWDQAFVGFGMNDLRGIQKSVVIDWNGEPYNFDPGSETTQVIKTGISTYVPMNKQTDKYNFNLNLELNGSVSLSFIPIGKTTTVNLHSAWPSPSFYGAFLPDERDVNNQGFTATWDVLHLNRSFPQSFKGGITSLGESSFGVKLIVPVDEYQKSTRSAKYASLFITLTFIIFFLVQIMNKVRVHPIQYMIVGLALCVFYTLLLGLSEQISFTLSYLIAAAAIVGMITLYAHSIFKSPRLTGLIGLMLVALYLFIYTIVQMEDYALLMGSIGLFLVLALIMYLSRKIDWYNIER